MNEPDFVWVWCVFERFFCFGVMSSVFVFASDDAIERTICSIFDVGEVYGDNFNRELFDWFWDFCDGLV